MRIWPLFAIIFAPFVVGASWMFWLLWFVPLHEKTWGPANMNAVAINIAAAIAILLILLVWTVSDYSSNRRWWWQEQVRK